METGKVIYIAPEKSGVAVKTGNEWKSQEFVIETNERYPRKVAFKIFGERKIAAANLRLGETVQVCYYPESHEYNGNYFTELQVCDIISNGLSRLSQTQAAFQG